MATATVGALRVVLGLDSAAFTSGLTAAQKHLQGVGARMQSFGAAAAAVGTGLTASLTAPLLAFANVAVTEAVEMRDALGSVSASLAAMGDVGSQSLQELQVQAEKLARSSLFEDDQILRDVTTRLLSFGNIANEQFGRAQQAAVDMAAFLKTDLASAATLVGRALADPARAASVLTRRFGAMPPAVEANIAALVSLGDTAGAQAAVLDYLNTKVANQAQAARDNAPPLLRMQLAFKALAGEIGKSLLPIFDRFALAFEGVTEKFSKLTPGMQQVVVVAGVLAAAIGPVLIVFGAITAAIGALLPVLAVVGAPLLAIAAAAAAVGVAFFVFRDEIVPILQSFAAALQDTLGPKLAPLWEALKGAVSAVGALFVEIFGEGAPSAIVTLLKGFGEVVARVFGAAVDLITGAINVITNVLKAIGALLRGDFSAMWGFLGQAVMAVVRSIASAFQTLFPEVVSWVRQTYEGVKAWLLDKFSDVVRGIVEKITYVKDAFFNLYDAVVGHSYIPDMVIAIAHWMGPRLQEAMVDPTLGAVDETAAAFDGMAQDVGSSIDSLFRSISSKDWKGAVSAVLDIFSGQSGNVGKYAKLGQDLLKHIPGFATGGSFKVGGSGGIDSQMMAFRATPGEMVDIRRPGQDMGGGGGSISFDLRGAVMTKDLLRQMQGMATQSGGVAFGAARNQVPADHARRNRFDLSRPK